MTDHKGMIILREILLSMRWDNQDGYCDYMGDGKWAFITTSLPQITPEQLNDLFEFAGIIPDVIIPLGQCVDCIHAIDGRERGYKPPCLFCKRLVYSRFIPA